MADPTIEFLDFDNIKINGKLAGDIESVPANYVPFLHLIQEKRKEYVTKLLASHSDATTEAAKDKEKALAEAEEKRLADLAALQAEHTAAIAKLTDEHLSAIAQQAQTHIEAVEALRAANDAEMQKSGAVFDEATDRIEGLIAQNQEQIALIEVLGGTEVGQRMAKEKKRQDTLSRKEAAEAEAAAAAAELETLEGVEILEEVKA